MMTTTKELLGGGDGARPRAGRARPPTVWRRSRRRRWLEAPTAAAVTKLSSLPIKNLKQSTELLYILWISCYELLWF